MVRKSGISYTPRADPHLYVSSINVHVPSLHNIIVDYLYNEEDFEWIRPWADVLICPSEVIHIERLWNFLGQPKVVYVGEPQLITRCDMITTPNGVRAAVLKLYDDKFIVSSPPFTLNILRNELTYAGQTYYIRDFLARTLWPFLAHSERDISLAEIELSVFYTRKVGDKNAVDSYMTFLRRYLKQVTNGRWTISLGRRGDRNASWRLCPSEEIATKNQN